MIDAFDAVIEAAAAELDHAVCDRLGMQEIAMSTRYGAIDISKFLTAGDSDNPIRALNTHGQTGTCLEHGSQLSSGEGQAGVSPQASGQRDQAAERPAVRKRLDWCIVGGESGPGARPFDVAWARQIVSQCKVAGVPVFVKQLGSLPVQDEVEWRSGDGEGRVSMLSARNHSRTPVGFVPIAQASRKGGDPSEWPEDLRVRQMPEAR